MMRAAWVIFTKDVRVQLRNRTVLILGFVAPLTLAVVLNLVFGGMGDPDAPVTFDAAVVDLDGGEEAARFVEVVEGLAATGLVDLRHLDDEAAAHRAVGADDVYAAWVVPAGFSAAIRSGTDTEITVVGEVDAPNTVAFAQAVAARFATGVATSTLAGLVSSATGVAEPDEVGVVAEEVSTAAPIASLSAVDAAADVLDTTTSLTAGMALFFVFFTAGLPLVSILEERSGGTLARLLVAPAPASSILAGKALAAMVLGTVSLAALMATSSVLMGADWGSPVGALVLAITAVFAAVGIMSVAGAVARTTEQAGNAQAIVAVVLGILGGAFMPIPGSGTGLLAQLQRATPHGWFTEGLVRLRADGLAAAVPSMLALLAIGAGTGAVGLRLARTVLRR